MLIVLEVLKLRGEWKEMGVSHKESDFSSVIISDGNWCFVSKNDIFLNPLTDRGTMKSHLFTLISSFSTFSSSI